MQTLYSAIILSICLNIGIGMMAWAFNVNIPLFINLTQFADTQQSEAASLSNSTNPFTTIFIFGNFLQVAQIFVNAALGQWLVGTVLMLGAAGLTFPPVLVAGLMALYAAGLVWGLMYLIGGRGTKSSD